MGADNGVVKEGVTQTDSSVTIQVLENMGDRLSTACVMCGPAGCELIPVNIGALTDGRHPKIQNRACGTVPEILQKALPCPGRNV